MQFFWFYPLLEVSSIKITFPGDRFNPQTKKACRNRVKVAQFCSKITVLATLIQTGGLEQDGVDPLET